MFPNAATPSKSIEINPAGQNSNFPKISDGNILNYLLASLSKVRQETEHVKIEKFEEFVKDNRKSCEVIFSKINPDDKKNDLSTIFNELRVDFLDIQTIDKMPKDNSAALRRHLVIRCLIGDSADRLDRMFERFKIDHSAEPLKIVCQRFNDNLDAFQNKLQEKINQS